MQTTNKTKAIFDSIIFLLLIVFIVTMFINCILTTANLILAAVSIFCFLAILAILTAIY
jgi:hypothetical protein